MRTQFLLRVSVGIVLVLGAAGACGSDDGSKRPGDLAGAGEGGDEPAPARGGSSSTPTAGKAPIEAGGASGGQAVEPAVNAGVGGETRASAGSGGEPPGGQAGAPSEAGAAGNDAGGSGSGGVGGRDDGAGQCCEPIKLFLPGACGALDDGCGSAVYKGCDDGKSCNTNPETGVGVCAICVPLQVECAGQCGMLWNGCDFVDCGDACGATQQTCGLSNTCCSKLDPVAACVGHCGDVYDPCDFSTISCGNALCNGGLCDQATNLCCAAAQAPCGAGACGVLFDNCNPGVDCGACGGADVCVSNHCQPSGCGSAKCGYLPSGENCGDCAQGDRCVDGHCVTLCSAEVP